MIFMDYAANGCEYADTYQRKLVKRRKGVPQGSPISPLLSLCRIDKELTRKGLKLVCYADDQYFTPNQK
jgi:retron-type reverse transcriptase